MEYLKLLQELLKKYPEYTAEILQDFQEEAANNKTLEADQYNIAIIRKLEEKYAMFYDVEEEFVISDAYDENKYAFERDEDFDEHHNVHEFIDDMSM